MAATSHWDHKTVQHGLRNDASHGEDLGRVGHRGYVMDTPDDRQYMWCDLSGGGVQLNYGHNYGEKMREPYLPYPPGNSLKRLGQGQAGFQAVHTDCEPAARPSRNICEERTFRSYGEWWQAHQRPPPQTLNPVRHVAIATTFWPYGPRVSTLNRTLEEACESGYNYILDNRSLKGVIPDHACPSHGATAVSESPLRLCVGPDSPTGVISGSQSPTGRRVGFAEPPEARSMSSSRSSPTLQLAGSSASRSRQQPLLGSNYETTRKMKMT